MPVVNTAAFGEARVSPAAERTPLRPPGTVTVTLVDGRNAVRGVNTIESPMICQVPGTLGVRVGFGDRAAGGAENVTWTGRLPLASLLPGAGLTDLTRNGPGRVTPPDGDFPPLLVSRYTPPPASSATTAVTAAITRVLDRPRLPSNLACTSPVRSGGPGGAACPVGTSPAPPPLPRPAPPPLPRPAPPPLPRSAGVPPTLLPGRLK